jgi:hypothetical protein
MYQIKEKTHNQNRKEIGVEIFKRVDDPEISDLIESKVILVSVIVPDGWEVLNVWKTVEEEIF